MGKSPKKGFFMRKSKHKKPYYILNLRFLTLKLNFIISFGGLPPSFFGVIKPCLFGLPQYQWLLPQHLSEYVL